MKLSTFVVSILALFFIYSCGEKEVDESLEIENEKELYELITPYLFLNEKQYELRLSKEDALQLGISKDQYEEAYFNIREVNAFIQSNIGKPNHRFELTDFQQKKEILPIIHTRDIETSDGHIHAMRNYSGTNASINVEIPRGYSKIRVTITPKCFFSAVTIGVGSQKVTFTGWGGGSTIFSIGMSPCFITINIASNCDSGGTVGYEIM